MITEYNKNVVALIGKAYEFKVPVEHVVVIGDDGPVSIVSDYDEEFVEFIRLGEYIDDNINEGLDILWETLKQTNFLTNVENFITEWMLFVNNDDEFKENFDMIKEFVKSTGVTINKYENFKRRKDDMREVFLNKLSIQTERLEAYQKIEETLTETKELYNSKITIKTKTIIFVMFDEIIDDLVGIFDSVQVDKELPYVMYIDSTGKPYHKVYEGEEGADIDFKKSLEFKGVNQVSGMIYLNILIDNEYIVGTIYFDMDKNQYVFTLYEIPIGDVDEKERIDELLVNIYSKITYREFDFPEEIQVDNITAGFDIYMANLIDYIFVDFVVNSSIFSNFLTVKENKINYGTLRSPIYIYQPFISDSMITHDDNGVLTFTMEEHSLYANSEFNYIEDSQIKFATSSKDTKLIHVNITNMKDDRVMEHFIETFKRLVYIYTQMGYNMCIEYREYIPELKNALLIPKLKVSKYSSERGEDPNTIPRITEIVNGERRLMSLKTVVDSFDKESKIERLKRFVPNIVKSIFSFARNCQVEAQPLIIHDDDVFLWESTTGHDVTHFGKDDQNKYNYVAIKSSDITSKIQRRDYSKYTSSPVVSEFTSVDKKSIVNFPCKKKDRNKDKIKSQPNSHILTSNKIMGPGRYGELTSDVKDYLEQNIKGSKIKRFGVAKITPNSFFHCVAHAFDDQYNEIKSFEEKEAYIVKLRKDFFIDTDVKPEVMAQEMWEYTNEEIEEKFKGILDQSYFDPLKYYRALEEHYECSIYVFSNDENRKEFVETLEIPHSDFFHTRVKPTKRVLLIIAHKGSERDVLTIPQCELIVDQESSDISFGEEKKKLFFDSKVNNIIYPVYKYISRTLSWNYNYTEISNLEARINMFSSFDYSQLFGEIVIDKQFINSSGKVRAFSLRPRWANEEKKVLDPLTIYVCVNETQPMNIEREEYAKEFPEYTEPVKMFGIPSGYSSNKGMVNYLWFKLADNPYGYHCPIKEISEQTIQEVYDLSDNNRVENSTVFEIPLEETKDQPTQIERYEHFMKVSQFIDQIYKYLYLVEHINNQAEQKPTSISEFISKVSNKPSEEYKERFASKSGQLDSFKMYNIDKLSRILPAGDTVEEILMKLNEQSDIMFPNNKIVIYNSKMFNGIQWRIEEFIKSIKGISFNNMGEFRTLKDFYFNEKDFTFNKTTTKLFLDKNSFESWKNSALVSLQTYKIPYTIQKFIDESAVKQIEPFVFQMTSEVIYEAKSVSDNDTIHNIYIVQNAKPSHQSSLYAITIALEWYYQKRNVGFHSDKYKESEIPAHVIYKIDNDKRLELYKDNTGGDANFIELLEYNTNSYAALLPIL